MEGNKNLDGYLLYKTSIRTKEHAELKSSFTKWYWDNLDPKVAKFSSNLNYRSIVYRFNGNVGGDL